MAQNKLKTQPASLQMQIVVRDKHGNVKYQGPLNMDVRQEEREKHGGDTQHGGPQRSR